QDQTVLILGKGNSAFETAEHLLGTAAVLHLISPHPLRFAWNTHYVGDLRSVNTSFIDSYLLKSQNALIDGMVQQITPTAAGKLAVRFVSLHADEIEELEYDRVLRCTGFRFDADIFAPACAPALTLNNRFPAMSSAWESVNVSDLYFAGTL